MQDGISDEVLVSAELCDSFSDDLELEMLIEEELEESPMAFVRVGDEWVGCGHRIGCGYAETRVSLCDEGVNVLINTGIRVKKEHMREVNKLVMLGNVEFRVSGFDLVNAENDTITFSFVLGKDHLLAQNDKNKGEESLPRSFPAGKQGPLALMRCPAGGDSSLSHLIQLAMSTVDVYLIKFNEVIFGGKTALEAEED